MKKRRGSVSVIPISGSVEQSDDASASSLKVKKKNYSFSYLKEFKVFVPKILIHKLVCSIGLNSAYRLIPFCHSQWAAIVVADIGGFVKLASKLEVEELKTFINDYFQNMIEVINVHRGDIIKFCGDSIMISWAVDPAGPMQAFHSAVLMATNCAAQLTEACRMTVSSVSASIDSNSIDDDEDPIVGGPLSVASELCLHCGVAVGTYVPACECQEKSSVS